MKIDPFLLLIPAALFMGPDPGYSQARPADPLLTLTDAVQRAVSDNAQLSSLRAKRDAMLERPGQAKALPNPMLSYGGMDMAKGGTWPDTSEKRIMVQQEFPWFGKRSLREGIAEKEAEIMQRDLDAMTCDVVMRVKESFYDLYAIRRVITIAQEEEAVLRRMVTIAGTRYASGKGSQADLIKAQTEITMLKQRLLELQAQENTVKAKLNTLLNRRADEPLGKLEPPPKVGAPVEAARLFAEAAQNRPEVLAAQTRIERYRLEKKLMEKEYLPDYKLGIEYRDIQSEDNMLMFTVSVELPVWQSKYEAGTREAERMQAASRAALEAAERQSAFDVQDAHFKLQTALRTFNMYRTDLVPQAESRFSTSEAGYQEGKVDFLDLLESERFLLNTKVMTAMSEGAAGVQAARLERAVGVNMSFVSPDDHKEEP
ncbi:MAG: Cobalt-zinc-cadmium resistance protein CzcC precursor [Verrucomicrobia bacterium ADurb.Bin070]|nr:MAG: Cobalt-zinc-cadmium resistance protein CzcC precursor [Verrucomicrobia bacterium ADurb.Bin070]